MLGLAACTTPSLVVSGTTVRVASSQPFTSFNDQTSFGNTPANRSIVAATNSGFAYYDETSTLVRDESFGHYEVVSRNPFVVRYTIAEGVTWSDGVAVDAADLLLAWAANSGAFTTEGFAPDRFIDPETGQFEEFPDGAVYFDGQSRSGLQFVTAVPEVSEDSRSITLTYDTYFVDWELAFDVGVPAHIVARAAATIRATDEESVDAVAKRFVTDAIVHGNTARLARIAAAWNSAFTVLEGSSPELLVGSGPYSVTSVDHDGAVTLTANPLYTGSRKPRFETVHVVTIADPLDAVAALRAEAVDVIAPTATGEVMAALNGIVGVDVQSTQGSAFEHVDLQFSDSKNGTFDDPALREAFLLTVPREQIVRELVRESAPDADVRDSYLLIDGDPSIAPQDIAAAKRLVAASGVESPRVCILFDPGNPRRLAEFDLIAEAATAAGFIVDDCSKSDWEGFLGVSGAYDAAIFAWDETTAAVSAPGARLHSTSTVSNFSHYANDAVDALLNDLDYSEDPSEQRRMLEEIDAALAADFYGVVLYQYPVLVAHRTDVLGVAPARLGAGLLWNVWEWEPAAEAE